MEIIRNMLRRKVRTTLTILGIVIGIFAFSVMGAMSEKMNLIIDDAANYMSGQINIMAKGDMSGSVIGTSLIQKDVAEKIKNVTGVRAVQKKVYMMLKDTDGAIVLGMPEIVEGYEIGTGFKNVNDYGLEIKEGRDLRKNDSKKAVVGIDIATNEDLEVGEDFKVRGTTFKVIGITTKTMSSTDKMVFVPIKDARNLLVKSQPFLAKMLKEAKEARKMDFRIINFLPEKEKKNILKARRFSLDDVANNISVSWKKGTNPEKLAKRIQGQVKEVIALSPKKSSDSFKNASVVINLIIMGSALIAVIVGGLSVINTMIISVNERTREIGVKRAVGAKTRHILTDYILEAAVIGLLGGLIGLGLAGIAVEIINANTIKKGVEIFLVTKRLAIASIAFSVILGILAGIYPAIHASRLNPVTALRSE